MKSGLDVVGNRWTLWLLSRLDRTQPARFSELLTGSAISRKVLAARLSELESRGWVVREQYSARPPRSHYLLAAGAADLGATARGLLAVAADAAAILTEATPAVSSIAPRLGPPGPSIADGVSMADLTSRLLEFDPQYAARVIESVLAPVLRYDHQYRTDLVHTLEVYLGCEASVSAAAERLFTHRHTVRYRLDRIQELSGLDVDVLADREQLVLALRALAAVRGSGT